MNEKKKLILCKFGNDSLRNRQPTKPLKQTQISKYSFFAE